MGGTLGILGVDSDRTYRNLYTGWLGADHDVRAVADGETALEVIENSCDIVFVSRNFPDMSGREVAAAIQDEIVDCHVVMVADKAANFDIVEFPIESYVRKPVSGPDLDEVLDQYHAQQDYQAALEEYFRLTSKLGAIEADLSPAELETSDRYERIKRRAEEKRATVDEAISASDTDWDFAFKSCARPSEMDALSQP